MFEAGKAAKLTDVEAAWQTWSGQRALENGFNKVEVSKVKNGIQGIFT